MMLLNKTRIRAASESSERPVKVCAEIQMFAQQVFTKSAWCKLKRKCITEGEEGEVDGLKCGV